MIRSSFEIKDKRLEREIFGIRFPNPVGLAAGFDKEAKYTAAFEGMGFGFMEIGTITPYAQRGNDKPRLFRLKEDEALINRMGFNNEGMKTALKRLKSRKSKIIIGGNIGKNKITPNDEAYLDYIKCFETLYPYVDYFTVNVSSPNTPNLRELQEKEPLMALLKSVIDKNQATFAPKPILLKIAPDVSEGQLDDIVHIAQMLSLDGIIATNTTIDRSNLHTSDETIESIGAGGLSGKPLRKRSTDVIRYLAEKTEGRIPIVAVGGIDSYEAAREKLDAGASLVQIYTGLIYKGPGLVKEICEGILASTNR